MYLFCTSSGSSQVDPKFDYFETNKLIPYKFVSSSSRSKFAFFQVYLIQYEQFRTGSSKFS
ncbi:hypothetical protein V1477_008150 [Vespula maculifrons]|uniref:Uncharacterized protein n=1 Tax=Vespula maculifrons TaxID=7453 RepID=A0ABD2CC68_VESMC